MTEKQSNPNRGRTDWSFDHGVGRRTFIAAGGGVGATLLAGCSSDSGNESAGGDEGGDTDGSTETDDGAAGTFRLLISDMPADIGDFDRLDVTLDSARIFDGEAEEAEEEEEDEANETEDERDEEEANDGTENESADAEQEEEDDTADAEEEEKDDDTEEDEEEKEDDSNEDRGFYVVDLEGATVDLTQVVGDKATPVGELSLSEGTYQKIELHVADVEGIVDGAEANVKIPSEKLQLTKPFEVRAGESVDFVFDINVVKRGQGNDYNLMPVISKSGVKGEDVEVEEVSEDDESEAEDEESDGEDDDSDGDEETEDESGDQGDGETDEAGNGDENGNESGTGDGEETDGN